MKKQTLHDDASDTDDFIDELCNEQFDDKPTQDQKATTPPPKPTTPNGLFATAAADSSSNKKDYIKNINFKLNIYPSDKLSSVVREAYQFLSGQQSLTKEMLALKTNIDTIEKRIPDLHNNKDMKFSKK